jgi:hypothetical protein
VRVCLLPSASLSVMEAHSLVASVGIMGRDWPAGPLREAASGAAGDHVVPPAQSGLTLYKSAPYLGLSCRPKVDVGLRGGTGRTGSEVRVSPSGLASWRSRSLNALIISGASKARFLRPTVTWVSIPADSSRSMAALVCG